MLNEYELWASRDVRRPIICVLLTCFALSGLALPSGADELRDGIITVSYDPADAAVGQRSLEVAVETLKELAGKLPAGNRPITVAVCHTYGEFRKYAGTLARPGVGGVAESNSGVLAVKAPGIQSPGADYEGVLRHELIHLMLARSYNVMSIPRWLNEGITMTLSGENRLNDRFMAGYMYVRGNLIAYPELPVVLGASEYDGRLGDAYAQSLSMTQFLMKRLGNERFWGLIRSLDTRTFPEALEQSSGMTIPGFMEAWKKSLWKIALVFSLVSGFSAFQLMILLLGLAYWRLRQRNRVRLARWKQEEEEDEPFMFGYELENQEAPYPWEEDDDEDRL